MVDFLGVNFLNVTFPDDDLCIRWLITLLHFFWQGTFVGGVAALAGWLLRSESARLRYAINSIALMCMPICVLVTFFVVEIPTSWLTADDKNSGEKVSLITKADSAEFSIEKTELDDSISMSVGDDSIKMVIEDAFANDDSSSIEASETESASESLSSQTIASRIAPWIAPWITVAYIAGVIGFLVRLQIALWGGHRLRSKATNVADSKLLKLIATQAARIKLKIVPAVAYCERVAVPTVVGALCPMILLPASLVSGLSPDDFAAIISHELAHIRRNDLWMNLYQRVVESLLFFHPIVWFISRRISAERELCCDDLVVSSGHQRLDYAGSLLRMAELCVNSAQHNPAALAATGDKTSLLEKRIERLIHESKTPRLQLNRFGILAVVSILVLLVAAPTVVHNWARANGFLVVISVEGTVEHSDDEKTDSESKEPSENQKDKAIPIKQKHDEQNPDEPAIDPNGEIRGRLIDNRTGNPVEGTLVACGAVINDSRKSGGAKTRTDAQGRYRLIVPSPGIYSVWIKEFDEDSNMTAAADDGLLVEAGKVTSSAMRLVPGRKVAGKVVNEFDKPMAGVTVMSYSAARPLSMGGVLSTKSAKDGSFQCNLPPGRAYVYASHKLSKEEAPPAGLGLRDEFYLNVFPYKDAPAVTLKLKKSVSKFGSDEWLKRSSPGTLITKHQDVASVTGVVVDSDGQPIVGAKVFKYNGEIIETNEKGKFEIESSRMSQFVMNAFHPGYRVWFGAPASGDQLKIVLEKKPVMKIGYFRGQEAKELIEAIKPAWSKTQLGIQYAIARRSSRTTFREGERVPLVMLFRNASDKPLEIEIAPDPHWNVPQIENKEGELIEIKRTALFGSIPLYRETLGPSEAFGFSHPGIGLGENPKPGKQSWIPEWKKPVEGNYKLTHTQSIGVSGIEEGDQQHEKKFTSGTVEFEVKPKGSSTESTTGDLDDFLKQVEQIVWSEKKDGIQFGIRPADGISNLSMDKPGIWYLHIQNEGEETVEVKLPGGLSDTTPIISDSQGNKIVLKEDLTIHKCPPLEKTLELGGANWVLSSDRRFSRIHR